MSPDLRYGPNHHAPQPASGRAIGCGTGSRIATSTLLYEPLPCCTSALKFLDSACITDRIFKALSSEMSCSMCVGLKDHCGRKCLK